MGPLSLEIVTPRGLALHETRLDEVVVRRKETEFDPGSELAILKNHGPLLAATAECDVRYRRGERSSTVHVAAGVLEVLGSRLLMLVPACER